MFVYISPVKNLIIKILIRYDKLTSEQYKYTVATCFLIFSKTVKKEVTYTLTLYKCLYSVFNVYVVETLKQIFNICVK